MGAGINKLARVLQTRMKEHDSKPPILDYGTIQSDMSLLTNYFPLAIPYADYMICRSVCYDPEIPLSLTWWYDEGWNSQTDTQTDWQSEGQKKQPQQWRKDRWGELVNPDSGIPFWDEKHKTPPISGADHIHNSKGEHDHEEDPDGKHYHDMYLPRKMYRIQPGDRVLVAWVGDDPCVIDIVMAATEMM